LRTFGSREQEEKRSDTTKGKNTIRRWPEESVMLKPPRLACAGQLPVSLHYKPKYFQRDDKNHTSSCTCRPAPSPRKNASATQFDIGASPALLFDSQTVEQADARKQD